MVMVVVVVVEVVATRRCVSTSVTTRITFIIPLVVVEDAQARAMLILRCTSR